MTTLATAASACPAPVTDGTVVAGISGARTLLAEDGREIVLAGLAFPQAFDAVEESGGDTPVIDAMARIATGPVSIGSTARLDRYGRLRTDVVLPDGRWLQAALIEAGLALVRLESEADPACVRMLLALEAAARAARIGLWADSNDSVKTADDPSLSARNGLYQLIEGRVVSVGYGSRMVFLDFGHDFRTDFTVMVPNSLVPRLLEAGIAVDRLKGRRVRVRGVIEESGGPAIRIADPLALELLDRAE